MSNSDLVQYIVEQAGGAGEIRARKMFGDYCLYCNDKPVGLICDDVLYLKPLNQLEVLLHDCDHQMQPPYDGAKPHYRITDIDNRDYISLLVRTVHDNMKK
jgi:TfoX/Sxy family transcriptional regulator of competence genes